MSSRTGKKLFTPGPLCCSTEVKAAMMEDLGSRDQEFIACVREIRNGLLEVAGVSGDEYTVVPLQGSGTYCVEAVLQTTSPKAGARVLVLANGAYGERMVKACTCGGLEVRVESFAETTPIPVQEVQRLLEGDAAFTTVALVHCETSSGVINPVEEVGRLVHRYCPGAVFFVDAMSSFGAVSLDFKVAGVDYLVSSANKCLEGVPGFSYAICGTQHLLSCRGHSRVMSLDLVEQYLGLENTGQFRFTPPTHTMLAFRTALRQYREEGGLKGGRQGVYRENHRVLVEGMTRLGYRRLLAPQHAGYIITAFLFPSHPNFDFTLFYNKLAEKGKVIYPGKVTRADCFRVGTIGQIFPADVTELLACVEVVMREMGLPVPLPS